MKKTFLYSKRRMSVFLISIFGLSIIIFFLSAKFDLFELAYSIVHKYEAFNVDELIILVFIWFVALFILVVFNHKTINKKNKALSELSSRLQETLDKKNQLFSIIGHDLKSPFNSIIGFSDLILRKFDSINNSKRKEMIVMINKSSKNAMELLNNLLDWGKIENSSNMLEKRNFDLQEVINSEIEFFRILFESKNITILNNIPDNTFVFADYQMIKTVIRNILSNAIKFSFLDSVIDISSSITLDNVQIAISDKGVGLTNDQINQLFYQYGKTTSRTKNERGTGLGLYICKKLIEKNNGKILVESKVGNGTKFIVEIPIPITK